MKIGLFLWGVLWLLAGGLVSFLGCFVKETCEYSSLIAPLPGVLFIYLSLRKSKSVVEEKELKATSGFYLKAFLFLFSVGALVFVEIEYFLERLPALAFSILFTTLGGLILWRVLQSIKTGDITIHREGVIGHGFHTYSKSNKFELRFTQFSYTIFSLFLLFFGFYSFYQFVLFIISLF